MHVHTPLRIRPLPLHRWSDPADQMYLFFTMEAAFCAKVQGPAQKFKVLRLALAVWSHRHLLKPSQLDAVGNAGAAPQQA